MYTKYAQHNNCNSCIQCIATCILASMKAAGSALAVRGSPEEPAVGTGGEEDTVLLLPGDVEEDIVSYPERKDIFK